MKFNVAECHSMRVTWHQHYKEMLMTNHYTIKLWKMFSRQNILVYIEIIDNMDWGQHILENSSRATKTLDFLCRDLAFVPRKLDTKLWFSLN